MVSDSARPAPFVPAELDLRDFQYMPLHCLRLRDSGIAAIPEAEAFRSSVLSWCASWHQVPGSSLEDNDVDLAKLLGYGRDVKSWKKIRAKGGLHGWVLCSDGRLYHKIVSEVALEAWLDKLFQRRSSGAGNAKQWGTEFDPTEIDAAVERAANCLKLLNPQSKALLRRKIGAKPDKKPPGKPTGNGRDTHPESERAPEIIPPALPSALPIEAQEKGREENIREDTKPAASESVTAAEGGPRREEITSASDVAQDFLDLRERFWPNNPNFPAPFMTLTSQAEGWIAQGGTRAVIKACLQRGMAGAAREGRAAILDFRYFNRSLTDDIARWLKSQPAGEDRPDPRRLTDAQWVGWLEALTREKDFDWPEYLGDRPGNPSTPKCLVPPHLQRKYGFAPATPEAA